MHLCFQHVGTTYLNSGYVVFIHLTNLASWWCFEGNFASRYCYPSQVVFVWLWRKREIVVSEHVQYVSFDFLRNMEKSNNSDRLPYVWEDQVKHVVHNSTHLEWENLPINSSRETIIISALTLARVKLISEGHQRTEGVDGFAELALHKIIGICGPRC